MLESNATSAGPHAAWNKPYETIRQDLCAWPFAPVSGAFASTGDLTLRSSKEPVTVGSVELFLQGPAAIFKGG
jgi:hypothetical protein